jgi:hypothetical protein
MIFSLKMQLKQVLLQRQLFCINPEWIDYQDWRLQKISATRKPRRIWRSSCFLCHNETIEALSRYRRGGEQQVVVQHIADKIAVVNNFDSTGGGGSQENKGASPCP